MKEASLNEGNNNGNSNNGKMVDQPATLALPIGGLRPRAARRPRDQAKQSRGLPEKQIILDLAVVYLNEQRHHWPVLAEKGILPDPANTNAVSAMVQLFCNRHLTGSHLSTHRS